MSKGAALKISDLSHFLEQLADNSNSVYWLSTGDLKRIAYLSPAYETIWGRSREELYSDPEKWLSYLHPDNGCQRHPIDDMARRIAESGAAARFCETYRIIRPDGEIRWIVDRGFPIFDKQGRCQGVTGVAMDMTKEKAHEEALRQAREKAESANRAKTALLANLSHDIRTPLAGILGLAQELIDAAKQASPKQLVKTVRQDGRYLFESAKALLDLFNDILDVVRLEPGQVVAREAFDLRELIKQQRKLMQPAARQKKLKLISYLDPQIPATVYGFRYYLDRILLNLLSNAIKFTAQGYVQIRVEADEERSGDAKGIPLKISVQDSGIGIPGEQFDSIFEPFTRLSPSYQGCYSGAGLGLYRVRHDAAKLGASIAVASEVGKGSCFTLRLRLE